MKISFVAKTELADLIDQPQEFAERLTAEVFIVRNYMAGDEVDKIRQFCRNFAAQQEPAWHPCVDGCPDYHRIHNNYPGAYVPAVQHAYYFHPWNGNCSQVEKFAQIYRLKLQLGQGSKLYHEYLQNLPSHGVILRLVVHNYPAGGGGQDLHIDPVSDFARVQTIIQASVPGQEYHEGGFYIDHPDYGQIDIDRLTRKGDLLLASPAWRHGVAPIDPEQRLDWQKETGRWIIMPMIIHSDVTVDAQQIPRPVTVDG